MEPIDFVVSWVDGNDPDWQAEKARVTQNPMNDGRDERYRDWELLRYWFRGVEQFASWVNRIHFVTWGHLPPWLNTKHPKLHIVNHRDYIPPKYLPTFSSHTIELNLHRIEGLAEHFVYFNDDMFLLQPIKPERFFSKDLPVDSALMNPLNTTDLTVASGDQRIFYIPFNDVQYLNRDFDMRTCIAKHPLKWYSLRYGSCLLRNLLLSIWPRFVGFVILHLPQAYRKETFAEAWLQDGDILDQTCGHQVRSDYDVSQSLIRFRHLAQGHFIPGKPVRNAALHVSADCSKLCQTISSQRFPMLCINDSPNVGDAFDREQQRLEEAFEQILPRKSLFEQ